MASDASFADNLMDRKSSQGYVMKLFGGLIAWRANKQTTVTTSTIEAELLSLSQVAKETLFVSRLLTDLTIRLDEARVRIACDNQQTIRLLKANVARLQTRLRHVDIHNHWLRQEIQKERIDVVYVPSNEMLADGLTKALPRGKWTDFLAKLGLEDIQGFIADRKLKELDLEDYGA